MDSHGLAFWGSSPHTRGLPALGDVERQFVRIIPAHAGFTNGLAVFYFDTEDHPRTRGVYRDNVRNDIYERGSSPHTRGLLQITRVNARGKGIIPAHAGFTDNPTEFQVYGKDHPRTRGVYLLPRG